MQPNLLFIFTDEQRYDTMAAYDNHVIQMPNLNRLASESIVFDRAYVTQPICTPSRSSLLTGLYPHTNGCTKNNVSLSEDVPSFPEMLSHGEYVTAYYGKWHLGDEIFRQHGFDDWRSIEDGYREYYCPGRDRTAHSTYHDFLVDSGILPTDGSFFSRAETARLPECHGKPAYLAREASRFIRDNRSRPFALFVGFLEPHMPFFGPRDNQYDPAEVTLPPNFTDIPTADQPLRTRLYHQGYSELGYDGVALRAEADWRRLIANYWGLCSLVDTHVGTILRTLEECGLADNTIVVYTSDHGDQMGSHGLLHKGLVYEESTLAPLLIRLPWQKASWRVSSPVSQIDLVPTLLDLMEQSVPSHVQGRSLRPLLCGRETLQRDVFIEWSGEDAKFVGVKTEEDIPDCMLDLASRERIWEAFNEPWRAVVSSDQWKFCCRPGGEHELYDLSNDPGETKNLARREELHPLMNDLLQRIRGWQDDTADTLEIAL